MTLIGAAASGSASDCAPNGLREPKRSGAGEPGGR